MPSSAYAFDLTTIMGDNRCIRNIVRSLYDDYKIIFLSGVVDKGRLWAVEQLNEYSVPYHELYMRPNFNVPLVDYKEEVIRSLEKSGYVFECIFEYSSFLSDELWRRGFPVYTIYKAGGHHADS